MTNYGVPSMWQRRVYAQEREPRLSARQCVSYHEAGHVMIGLRNGMDVRGAWVNNAGKGQTRFIPGDSQPDLNWLGKEMQFAWAGSIAQSRVDRNHFAPAADDRERLGNLMRMAMVASGDHIFAAELYERARGEAEATVDRYWPLIEMIAAALNKRGHLLIDEVWMVMRGERLPKPADKKPEPELMLRFDGHFIGTSRPPYPNSKQVAVLTREFRERYRARCATFGEPRYTRTRSA
jgi:hypothetical protein